MERVAFLVEDTGERIRCLLNPETIELRRSAGLKSRESIGGSVSGSQSTNESLLMVGGGRTEIDMQLLFDMSLSNGSSILGSDVRSLTGPIWALAENSGTAHARERTLPIVRFVWGKSWNIRCVVDAIAERLEQFNRAGVPTRSWMSIRMLKIDEESHTTSSLNRPTARNPFLRNTHNFQTESVVNDDIVVHTVKGTVNESSAERLDQIAFHYYTDAGLWRELANFNNLDEPLNLIAGTTVEIPSLDALKTTK